MPRLKSNEKENSYTKSVHKTVDHAVRYGSLILPEKRAEPGTGSRQPASNTRFRVARRGTHESLT